MREFASAATRNSQGVALPGDAKVTAFATPGGGVNVASGSTIIRNAMSVGESYIGRISSSTTVAVPATSGTTRSDLIVARVIDPDFSPWQPYTDPTAILFGPYFELYRVPGVAASTTKASQVVSYSAVALARIDIPASTTNITNAMITDLRGLAQPRTGFANAVQQGTGSFLSNTHDKLLIGDTTYRTWPNNTLGVTVPEWATNCFAQISLQPVRLSNPGGDFFMKVQIGSVLGPAVSFDNNGNPAFGTDPWEGPGFTAYADLDVRSLQGQSVVCFPWSARTGTLNGPIFVDYRSQIIFDLRFQERTV